MKKNVLIIFLIVFSLSYSQTEEELINSILTSELLESDCVGIGCEEGKQYLNFKKLKKIITKKELIQLTKHENPYLRMYASIDLIESHNANLKDMFEYEVNQNEIIETISGCLINHSPTYSIIYESYYGEIFFKVYEEDLSVEETTLKQEKLLLADKNLEDTDRMIITFKDDLNWLLYRRIFEFRKFKESDLKHIEYLAFTNGNYYALMYLKHNHSNAYDIKIDDYFRTSFISTNFDSDNGVFYLYNLIEHLLDSGNEDYKKTVINKLKTDKTWKREETSFRNTLKDYGISI